MKVLIAYDTNLIRERLKEMVSVSQQLEVVGSFANGTDTLEGLRTLKPDLAIIGLEMTGLNGIEVLKEIRKENSSLVYIILTLFSSEFYREMATEAGADYFFSKPDDFKKVARVMVEMVMKEEKLKKHKITCT
jgi:two-component system, response regulator YesN